MDEQTQYLRILTTCTMATITKQNSTYKLPRIYNFPPLFTIQPVETTRTKQLDSWCSIITAFHEHHNKTILSVNTFELFDNKTINRTLNNKDRIIIIDHIVQRGYGEWISNKSDNNKTQCMIFYKTLNEWVKIICDFARKYSMIGT